VRAPGAGPGFWAGAASVARDRDGTFVIGYRVRNGHDGIDQTVVARSPDGEAFTTVATLEPYGPGARWMERPAIVRTEQGSWRLYTCCGAPATKRWWIDVREADDPAGLETAEASAAFPGDERTAVKDPVVRLVDRRWHAWICCHPLDVPGAEDRMSTAHATSDDGLSWQWHGTVLAARPGTWYARGARLTTLFPDGRIAYDGRATAEENWFERTGIARPAGSGQLVPVDGPPVADVRYLEVLPLSEGRFRIYYEARLPDESHELRTELIEGAKPPSHTSRKRG
jgi:hypothetical protein